MAADRSWQSKRGGTTFGVIVGDETVTLYEEQSPHEGGGIVIGHDAFLNGKYSPEWDDALGSQNIDAAKDALRALRESPAGAAYLALARAWSELPVRQELLEIARRPDPFGFADAAPRNVVALSIAGQSVLEARGPRLLVIRDDGSERAHELAAPVTAGLVIEGRYWLLSDRLHVLDASGEPVLDSASFAARIGAPQRLRLEGLAHRGAEVVLRYRCRTPRAETALGLATGMTGWAQVDLASGTLIAKLPYP